LKVIVTTVLAKTFMAGRSRWDWGGAKGPPPRGAAGGGMGRAL